jgi:hypothetical protein
LSVDRKLFGTSTIGSHPARSAPAVAPHGPRCSADACRSAIGRPFLQIGSLGLDVYEGEADLFFDDKSGTVIQDELFMRLLAFPNVIVTAHQAFFTRDALEAIASQTVRNLQHFARGEPLEAVVAMG